MAASSPGLTSAARLNFRNGAGWLLAGLALTAFFYSPLTQAMDPSLDASNYASYAYFTAHHFQYGHDVVPMYGPLGFVLPGAAYNGELYWARMLGQLAGNAGLAALLLWLFHRARGTLLRWLWPVGVVFLVPYITDLPFVLALLLGGLFLLEGTATAGLVAVAALLAFISLIKGTHLILCAGTLAVVVGFHLTQRNWRRAQVIAAAFLVTWLGCWLGTGQSLSSLPAFLRGVAALASGYNDAMALEEPVGVLRRGLLAAAMLAGGLGWGLWCARRQPRMLAGWVLFAAFSFALWKHGFVRADGHVAIFHHFAAVAVLLWFLYAWADPARTTGAPPRGAALGWLVAGVIAALWIKVPVFGDNYLQWLVQEYTPLHARKSYGQLLHPARDKAVLDAELARNREKFSLPLVRGEVGDRPVDFFGSRHGVLLLNGLDYRPRPMGGGSFNVYNPYLMELNRAFIADARRRPPYYLLQLETIDGRFAAQDDGLALLELIGRYRPLLREEGYVLLQSRETETISAPVPLASQQFHFGERVPVPAVPANRLLVARFDIPASVAGEVRRFLYKLPPVTIVLQPAAGEPSLSRRLIPGMAASPFLFSPLVENTAGLIKLFGSEPGAALREFSLETPDASAYAGELRVEFSTMPRPAAARAPDVAELLAEIPEGLFTVPPAAIAGPETRPLQLGKLRVQQLYAPGQMTWTLDGTEQELVFGHGLLPETFTSGHGNGVNFQVELQSPGAAPQVLFARLVDPSGHPADRRTLTSRVPLPPHLAGSTLVLRTDPGPHGDNAWDWSYVTGVQLKPAAAGAVFNRPPVALSGSVPTLAELDGDRVVLLHVPGEITLGLRDRDHQLDLEFGFLPGAYTGEGHTMGADFTVELERAGQPPREIFRRSLQPLTNAADRGRQHATVSLPDSAAGDRLVLRTRPVAGGNASWGWTYFSRATIE